MTNNNQPFWTLNETLKTFWYIVVATILGSIWLNIELNFRYYKKIFSDSPMFLAAFLIILFITLILWIRPYCKLRREKIHEQGSWVLYIYIGIFSAPVFSNIIISFIVNHFTLDGWLWRLIFLFSGLLFYKFCIPKLKVEEFDQQFASGAIGADKMKDKLNFLTSAKNAAKGLLKLPDYVNVIALHGGLGEGKSSYARMMIESIEANKLLYTYISLTETNEAKDFSKLFAERWLDTLQERYPKIDVGSYLPVMRSVLRESGNGIISDILSFIMRFNPGLLKTQAQAFDEYYKRKGKKYSDENIARMFGNIPEIKEDLWAILIDEIERAQFDEIYRMVEIIERFKNEGRSGLPIRIAFLLCISKSDLEELLKTFTEKDSRAYLLREFFFQDPKNITQNLFLPAVDPELKKNFVLESLKDIATKYQINLPDITNV